MADLILHNYFRSSTSVRLRAAINLKGLDYRYVAHHLARGEHMADAFRDLNPQALVPTLVLGDGRALSQSLAIIEYLDEVFPEPPLLPGEPFRRAEVRAIAYAIACDIHPLNNLRVLNYIRGEFGADAEAVATWFRHWAIETMAPVEAMLRRSSATGRYASGEHPGLADLCLYAQVHSNRRFQVDMEPYPTVNRIFAELDRLPAFSAAAPERQPDAE